MLYSNCKHCGGIGQEGDVKCSYCAGAGIIVTAGSDDMDKPQPKPENVMVDNLLREVEQAVRCRACGKLHPIASEGEDGFFTFHGNVTIGAHGGIIGNNLDDEGRVVRVMVYCRQRKCLQEVFLQHLLPDDSLGA